MSHELHAILGFRTLLQREAVALLPAEQRSQLEHVRTAGDHLLSLVNAMLINLLSNAIKYNRPGGEVSIVTRPTPRAPRSSFATTAAA